MLTDTLSSLKDNLYQKTRNPYLGTLLVVWCAHNWQLVYGLFNFDEKTPLDVKLWYIDKYFREHSFLLGFWTSIYLSFLVLIGTYLAINLSRLVINFYEYVVTPWAYWVASKSSIVEKSKYEELLNTTNDLRKRLEEERQDKLTIIRERDELEKNLATIQAANMNLRRETSELQQKLKESQKPMPPKKDNPVALSETEFKRMLERILNFTDHSVIREFITDIDAGHSLTKTDIVAHFINQGLIIQGESVYSTSGVVKHKYLFTNLGERFAEIYRQTFI